MKGREREMRNRRNISRENRDRRNMSVHRNPSKLSAQVYAFRFEQVVSFNVKHLVPGQPTSNPANTPGKTAGGNCSAVRPLSVMSLSFQKEENV